MNAVLDLQAESDTDNTSLDLAVFTGDVAGLVR